jgi:dihydrofolate synthase/folylpolyglutamate synthase
MPVPDLRQSGSAAAGSYPREVAWAYSLQPRGVRLELDRMRAALHLFGSPERSLKVVHVAGTNGKGSVSAMIERGLRENGLRTGLYTSPHLHSFTERVQVGGQPVRRAVAARWLRTIRERLARPGAPALTFFEVATLLAFLVFRAERVDVAVLEVGLGGRLDATNVIARPLLTLITSIDRDHEAYLGKTIAKIAGEKAGILERGVPCLSGVRQPSAQAAIARRAIEVGAEVVSLGEGIRMRGALDVEAFGRSMTGVRVPLAGAHQRRNAALAAAALLALERRLGLDREASRRGLEATTWPGRLELVPGAPAVLLDAAHNRGGARALAAHLAGRPQERRVLVFGAMRDKDWPAMLDALAPHVSSMIFCAPPLGRAEDPKALAKGRGTAAPSVEAAVERAQKRAGPRGLVVVCGSIFVLAAARAHLLGIASDPPIAM